MSIYKESLFYITLCFFAVAFVSVAAGDFRLLIAYMLFAPFIDVEWYRKVRFLAFDRVILYLLVFSIIALVMLAGFNVELWHQALLILATAALPEEWFFRAYLQTRLASVLSGISESSQNNKPGQCFYPVLIVSVIFSISHAITISWLQGLLVFIPSMLFGYLYYRYRNLLLIVILHLLSNLVFQLYIVDYINPLFNQ